MQNSKFIIVSDDYAFIQRSKAFAHSCGVSVEVFSTSEWENSNTGGQQGNVLTSGLNQASEGATILPFPGTRSVVQNNSVKTINELESVAIEKAILEYNGNLTEAAKALGIGRATLYRKVKLYNIDPSIARSKKRAA